MKEVTQLKKDEVVAVAEVPVEAQEVFQGRQRIHAGQKCWKINGKTFEVQEATFVTALEHNDQKKILMEKGYWYVVALNPKNALRKLDKMIKQMQQVVKEVEPQTEA